ncbi:MAG: cellulose synthase subunit BcsC-related outer membrane protein [Janthinobacterium lividum]
MSSATYWTLVGSASTARQAGDMGRARDLLERAIRLDPNDVTAQNALGDVLLAAHDPQGAEAAYRMALRRQADNPDAIRGVVGALSQQGRAAEALQFAERLSEQERERIGGLGALRAQQQQASARTAEQRGDLATARTDLENALLNDPQSPWIRLDLARVYNKLGALANARSVMDGLIASNPDLPDALYASALLYAELRDWDRVLQMLDRIAPQKRTRDMTALQRRAWVHANVDRASALAQQGQTGAAHALLEEAQSVAGTDPELLGAVAGAFADANDDNRAIGLIRQLLAQSGQPDAGLRMQYAGILLRTGQDAELVGVLRQLQDMSLTDAQRTDLGKLQQALAIRQADVLRLSGDLANAYEAIAPAIAANPDDPDLQAALARMYAATGEYDQALRLYVAAHKTRPADLDLTMAAAGTAAQARNFGFAEDAIGSALQQAPADPRVLAAAGRIYRAAGNNGKAAAYFRQALAAENARAGGPGNGAPDTRSAGAQGGADGTAQYANNRLPTNPFIGRKVIGAAMPANAPAVQGANASGAPTPGQFSGTGGPSGMPGMPGTGTSIPGTANAGTPGAEAPASFPGGYPYPTQAYPSSPAMRSPLSPSSSQTMPYLPSNVPAQYAQQVPGAATPAAASTMLPVNGRVLAPSSSNVADTRGMGEDSEGADYSGTTASGTGYGDTVSQPQQVYQQPQQVYQQPQQVYQQPQQVYQQPQQVYQQPQQAYQQRQQVYQQPQQAYQQPQQVYQQPQQIYQQQPAYRQVSQAVPPSGGYAPWPADPAYAQARNADTDCDSSGADGGTRSAAGSNAGTAPQTVCLPPVPRRAARKVARRAAAPPRDAAASGYASQQTYAPVYAQQPPLPQYAAQPVQQVASVQQIPVQAAAAPQWNQAAAPASVPGAALTVQQELDQINQQTTSTVAAGVSIHNRTGESGLSSLTDIEAPLEGRVRAGNGHVVVQVTPVTLDAGTPSTSYAVGSRFGAGPAAAYKQYVSDSAAISGQTANGVGISGGYETDRLRVDVGSTPVGFKETNVVGGLNFRGSLNDQTTYTLDASRRAVTDSLLSYAGVRDNRTGLTWGGVTSSGARADVTHDDGTNGVYGYGSYGFLAGTNVENNTRAEAGGGVYTRLLKQTDRELSVGVNVTWFSYDKNLRYFTYGQGGYFSPQQYISLSVPVSWTQSRGKFGYQVKGSLGIQHFRENASDYFPTNATLQAAAVAAQAAAVSAGAATSSSAVYPGQSKTGLGYSLQASAEYQFAPQMFFGGSAGIDNARDYSQWFGGIYLRYAFEKSSGSPTLPPAPLHSPYLAN